MIMSLLINSEDQLSFIRVSSTSFVFFELLMEHVFSLFFDVPEAAYTF